MSQGPRLGKDRDAVSSVRLKVFLPTKDNSYLSRRSRNLWL